MLQKSRFEPAWWLRNAHAQTVWATLMRPEIPLERQLQRLELPDGDFIDLIWDSSNAQDRDKPIVLILHGLGGSTKSPYAFGLIDAISRAGWRPLFMHFRGSSGEPNRLARFYHSGDTDDLAAVVQHVSQTNPNVPIAAIGISMGGNVILKWMGETAEKNPLAAAVAVSVPFELNQTTSALNKGLSKIYQWHLLKELRTDIGLKFKDQNMDCPFELEKLSSVKSFREFDDLVTAPLHQFENAQDYYAKASSRQYLSYIQKPALIIHSEDDPFMPKTVIPSVAELSPSTIIELSQYGGHVGFVEGDSIGKAEYWLETRIPAYLEKFLSR